MKGSRSCSIGVVDAQIYILSLENFRFVVFRIIST